MEFEVAGTVIRVNQPDRPGLMAEVARRFAGGEGFALATLNLDHLVKLGASPAFRRAYAVQDFVVADGNPVVWLSWLAGRPVRLVPGADLVLPLARLAAGRGVGVVLLGATGESLAGAAARLRHEAPGLKIAAQIAPPMGFDPEGEEAGRILKGLAGVGPCLCLLALGAPKQEILAARGRVLAPAVGFASIGAGLDFLSGHQRRAPRLMRMLALEWLWRAAVAPKRLVPRYLACGAILPGLALAAIRQRRAGKDGGAAPVR